jgi:hypothetical protein
MTDLDVRAEWQSVMLSAAALADILKDVPLRMTETQVAQAMRFGELRRFRKYLAKQGLPPFRDFRRWYLSFVIMSEAKKSSLAHFALSKGQYPAVYYRFLQSATGKSWSELSALGVDWLIGQAVRHWKPYLPDPTRR